MIKTIVTVLILSISMIECLKTNEICYKGFECDGNNIWISRKQEILNSSGFFSMTSLLKKIIIIKYFHVFLKQKNLTDGRHSRD